MTGQNDNTSRWIEGTQGSRMFIGPFWMGTPEQIAQTQDAIDAEIALYYGSSDEGDKSGNTNEESRND